MSERTESKSSTQRERPAEGHESTPGRHGVSERTESTSSTQRERPAEGVSEEVEDVEDAEGVEVPAVVGVPRQALGPYDDEDDDDRPLPDLPPLPADPRWRVAHLPFLSSVAVALMLCAASVGFFTGGPASALGAATGVLIVTLSFTMSTLVIAWADTVRPALLMPMALLTYVLKYTVLGVVLAYGVSSDWTGKKALGLGIVAGVMVWTGVQVWWFQRLSRPK